MSSGAEAIGAHARARTRASWGGGLAAVLRGTGELLITAGLLVLLFVAYLLYWTDFENSRTQSRLHADLSRAWAAPAAVPVQRIDATGGVDVTSVPLGTHYAEIHIPRLGKGYDPVMVEGTGEEQLQQGPGHYAGSALPGQDGNFAVAGHRTTYGKPFNRLAEIRVGDKVVVETRSAWVTYTVTGEEIVDPSDASVITPEPPPIGNQKGSSKLLTFTTCNPEYSAAQRLILRGVWQVTDLKRPGFVPDALARPVSS